jgi:hypothetical protein
LPRKSISKIPNPTSESAPVKPRYCIKELPEMRATQLNSFHKEMNFDERKKGRRMSV